jgi:hypothetical protein
MGGTVLHHRGNDVAAVGISKRDGINQKQFRMDEAMTRSKIDL